MMPQTARASAEQATAAKESIIQVLQPLIVQEIIGISALDAAIAGEHSPGYVVLFQEARTEKQANVEQMATVLRMAGTTPDETATVREFVARTQSRAAEALGGTAATLKMLRHNAREMFERYGDALTWTRDGLARIALRKARDRTAVQRQTLTAHIARHTGDEKEAAILGRPLEHYFAGPRVKVCFRCHFDRPGNRQPLERTDPHPYTYICAGCHDDVIAEFRPDFTSQMSRWTERAREARAIQHALGRTSRLMAAHTVVRALCGLVEEPPVPGPEKVLAPPLPGPAPDPSERPGVTRVEGTAADEAAYVAVLFDSGRLQEHW